MDAIQLDFFITCAPIGLAMLLSLFIMVRISLAAGILLLLPFGFLLGHMYIFTFASEHIGTFEQTLNPANEIVTNFVIDRRYALFLRAKAAAYCGIPLALWLLCRRIPGKPARQAR